MVNIVGDHATLRTRRSTRRCESDIDVDRAARVALAASARDARRRRDRRRRGGGGGRAPGAGRHADPAGRRRLERRRRARPPPVRPRPPAAPPARRSRPPRARCAPAEPAALLLGGAATRGPGAARRRAGSPPRPARGCSTTRSRRGCERGARRSRGRAAPLPDRDGDDALAGLAHLVVAARSRRWRSSPTPAGRACSLTPTTRRCTCSPAPREDAVGALDALADAARRRRAAPVRRARRGPRCPTGALDPPRVGAAVARAAARGRDRRRRGRHRPRRSLAGHRRRRRRTTGSTLTGGAIGQGLPVATGAAVACPDRPVLSLEADGSAMYTIQALWTQAREGLDVTTVIFANRSLRDPRLRARRASAPTAAGPRRSDLLELGRPGPRLRRARRGHGRPRPRAPTTRRGARRPRCSEALAEPGPHLIEARV